MVATSPAVAAVAGALTTIVVWLVSAFTSVDIPAEVSAALTTVIIAAILAVQHYRRASSSSSTGGKT